jgi:hypothetical protein
MWRARVRFIAGIDIMIKKKFSPKKLAKIGVFLCFEILIIIIIMLPNFGENRRKLPKIVIKTLKQLFPFSFYEYLGTSKVNNK